VSARQAAAAATPLRAVIVFDTSGSMRQSDPGRLSQAAAKLFLALAGSQDVVGLVAFSDHGVPLVPPTPLTSPALRTWFQTQLDSLHFTGRTTNLAAALESGLAALPPQERRSSRDVVLLLTDGKLDLGPQRRADEPTVLRHIQQELLPQYTQRGIALYTIAFTEGADRPLLQKMAQATGGEYRFIPSALGLHEVFQDLFQIARQAETLPLTDQAFFLDASIRDASLVVSKTPSQESVRLLTPHHEQVQADSPHAGITWTSTPAYDLVQFRDPTPGRWQIEGAAQAVAGVALVGHSTLHLHVDLHPAYHEAGEDLVIEAFLDEQGQRVQDQVRLQQLTMQVDLTPPQGEITTRTLTQRARGLFTTTLQALQPPGRYQVRVTATGFQLQRQRTLTFTLHPRCFQPVVDHGPPVTVSVTLAETCPALRSLIIDAGVTRGEAPAAWIPLRPTQPGIFATALPPYSAAQAAAVVLRIQGARDGEPPFTMVQGPWPLPTAVPSPVSPPRVMRDVLYRFVLLNAVLALVAGVGCGGFYVYRRRQRSNVHG
jgi:hypothetical protein